MKIELHNYELISWLNLLSGTTAKGKQARAVARFKKILLDKFELYREDELDLLKGFCVLNKNNEVDVSEDGTFTFLDGKKIEGSQALIELKNEEVVIDLTEFEPFVDSLVLALDNSEQELIGEQMNVLDELVVKLENLKGDN